MPKPTNQGLLTFRPSHLESTVHPKAIRLHSQENLMLGGHVQLWDGNVTQLCHLPSILVISVIDPQVVMVETVHVQVFNENLNHLDRNNPKIDN